MNKNRILLSVLGTLFIAAIIFGLDYVYITQFRSDLYERFSGWYNLDALGFIWVLMLLAIFSHRLITRSLLIALALMQAAQLGYFSYFGVFYGPYDIWAMFFELEDTAIGFWSEGERTIPPMVLTLLLWAAAMWGLKKCHTGKEYKWTTVLFVLIYTLPAIQIYGTDKDYFRPSYNYHSSHNALYTLNYFVASVIPNQFIANVGGDYQPYETKLNDQPKVKTIVVVLGESVTSDRLQVMGYDVDNTPMLQELKDRGVVEVKYAAASASTTQIAGGMLLNSIYEPDNPKQFASKKTNLFRLAKQQGYNTYYITTQKTKTMSYYFYDTTIDTYLEYEDMQDKKTHGDRRLLETIKELDIDFSQNNFIVLQHRNAHTPYDANYPEEFARFPPKDDSYQEELLALYHNTLLYFDFTMAELIEYLEEKTQDSAALFYASDHGEMVGEDGLYGHRSLIVKVAKIPFFIYQKNIPQERMSGLFYNEECVPTHYNIARSTAQLMGVDIINPNYQAGIAYMNGLDISGSQGYLEMDLARDYPIASCQGERLSQAD